MDSDNLRRIFYAHNWYAFARGHNVHERAPVAKIGGSAAFIGSTYADYAGDTRNIIYCR